MATHSERLKNVETAAKKVDDRVKNIEDLANKIMSGLVVASILLVINIIVTFAANGG